jgi:hypothetical protein
VALPELSQPGPFASQICANRVPHLTARMEIAQLFAPAPLIMFMAAFRIGTYVHGTTRGRRGALGFTDRATWGFRAVGESSMIGRRVRPRTLGRKDEQTKHQQQQDHSGGTSQLLSSILLRIEHSVSHNPFKHISRLLQRRGKVLDMLRTARFHGQIDRRVAEVHPEIRAVIRRGHDICA